MAKNTEYTTLIENYLSGGMSSLEKATFENELAKNTTMQSELNQQSELVEGIKSFRKIELKSRLAAINVNPTVLGIISQATALKSAVIAGTAMLIATGAYFYFDWQKTDFDLQKINSISEYVLNENGLPEAVSNLEPVKIKEYDIKVEPVRKNKIVAEILVKATAKVQSPNFQVPTSPDVSESEDISTNEELIKNKINDLENLSSVGNLNKVVVQSIIDKEYKFHYQYSEGKLYLYGKFDTSPYEIIEINRKTDKSIFFFYNDRYYKVEKNIKEVTPFKMISDLKLIRELKILKAK